MPVRTLADFPDLVERYLLKGPASNPNAMVAAPCCGRRTAACTVLDVRAAPGTIVAAGGFCPPKDHDWLCDGCRSQMIRERTNSWTESRLLAALGAPAQIVLLWQARETVDAEEAAAHRRGETFVLGGRYEAVLAQLIAAHLRAAEAALP